MKAIITSFILLQSFMGIYSQTWDTSAAKYLPLKVGNVWVYQGYSAYLNCLGGSWYDKYVLTGTTQVNGKTYYNFSHTLKYISGNCSWSSILFSGAPIRLDSASMNIYLSTGCGNNEQMVDSLRAGLGDSSWECTNRQGRAIVFTDTSSYSFCGVNRPVKSFLTGYWENYAINHYAKDIGLLGYQFYCGGSYTISLKGCVIDGVVCGDTSTIVGIKVIGNNIPQAFSLSQNYPNPFNPRTKIRFDIPVDVKRQTSNVKLVIYDVLGREIKILLNEQFKPGTYEVEWDATNFPSGVYFYSMIVRQAGSSTEDYSVTKKMVLVK